MLRAKLRDLKRKQAAEEKAYQERLTRMCMTMRLTIEAGNKRDGLKLARESTPLPVDEQQGEDGFQILYDIVKGLPDVPE